MVSLYTWYLSNNISAVKANFVMMGLNHTLLEHPRIKYFTKSMGINRPLTIKQRNIMCLDTLADLVRAWESIPCGYTFRAIFLMEFFGFMPISNLVPHSYAQFDSSLHLTLSDITFQKRTMKVHLKWSKTMQSRDKIHTVILPKLAPFPLCPVSALKSAISMYSPAL